MNYNEQAKRIHKLNYQWWHDQNGNKLDRNRNCLLMLVVTELAEACEGIRKDLNDDHLPQYKMATVELGDARIRLLDYSGGYNIEIPDHSHYNSFIDELDDDIESQAEGLMYIVTGISDICYGDEEGYNIRYVLNSIAKYSERFNHDIDNAERDKLIYNKTRLDHRIENRMKENGKKI